MSQKFLKHYGAYHRHILREVMSEKELNHLDELYNEAKIKTLNRRIRKGIENRKGDLERMRTEIKTAEDLIKESN